MARPRLSIPLVIGAPNQKEWNELEEALDYDELDKADLATLEKFRRVVANPPPSINDRDRVYQLGETIRYLIRQKEAQKQHKLDLKLNVAIAIIAAIVGAAAGAMLTLWLQDKPLPKQSEPPPRSSQQESVPSKSVDRTEKAESVPSKSP
jgi:hypothetical protein